MSPTYWTASQIKAAARENGWVIVKARPTDPDESWGACRGRHRVLVKESRSGGLVWARFHYPTYGGINVDHIGSDYRGKLGDVLEFLKNPDSRNSLLLLKRLRR